MVVLFHLHFFERVVLKMEASYKNCFYCLVAGLVVISLIQQSSSHTSQPRYYRSTAEDGIERVVEIVPSSVTVRPRPRQRISSAFAKQYWTTGNFFNRDNFRGI